MAKVNGSDYLNWGRGCIRKKGGMKERKYTIKLVSKSVSILRLIEGLERGGNNPEHTLRYHDL